MTTPAYRGGVVVLAFSTALGPVAARTAAAQTGAAVVMVDPLRSDLSSDDRIGAKRTGVLCAPAGAVLWSEAAPDRAAMAERVVTTLNGVGVAAVMSGESPSSPVATLAPARRLTVTIAGADIDACVPQHGWFRMMGGRKTLKAQGSVKLRWRVNSAGQANGWEREFVEELDRKEPVKSLPGAIEAAVISSARKMAVLLGAPERTVSE